MKTAFFLFLHVVVQFKWGSWAVAQILISIHIAFSEHRIECLRVVNISLFTLDNAQINLKLKLPPPFQRATHGHLAVFRTKGVGNLNFASLPVWVVEFES